jgi:hypothetical protein
MSKADIIQIYVGIEYVNKLKEIKRLIIAGVDPVNRNLITVNPSKILGPSIKQLIDDRLSELKKESDASTVKYEISDDEVVESKPIDFRNSRF